MCYVCDTPFSDCFPLHQRLHATHARLYAEAGGLYPSWKRFDTRENHRFLGSNISCCKEDIQRGDIEAIFPLSEPHALK